LKETLQTIEDNGRGVLETYHALSVAEFAGHAKAKNTIPLTVITGILVNFFQTLY